MFPIDEDVVHAIYYNKVENLFLSMVMKTIRVVSKGRIDTVNTNRKYFSKNVECFFIWIVCLVTQ